MRLALLPALVLAALPAHAEVTASSDAGFVVREVAEVPADKWATWSALTSPAKWWNAEHTWSGKAENLYIDSQATGCFCELMPVPEGAPEGTRRGSVEHMHIIHSNPGAVLRMKGALGPLQGEAVEGVLTVALKPTAKGTRIVWEYVVGGYMRMKPAEIAPAVDKVLAEQVASLAKLLGGEATAEAKPEPAKPAEAKPEESPKTEPMEKAPVADPAPAPAPAPQAEAAPAIEPAPVAAADPVPAPNLPAKPAAKPAAKKGKH